MQYNRVTYGRTYNTGNYSSERIDIQAEVEEGDDPEAILNVLREWVAKESLQPEQALRDLKGNLEDAYKQRADLASLTRRLAEARRDWERVVAVYTRLGLPIPQEDVDEIPF